MPQIFKFQELWNLEKDKKASASDMSSCNQAVRLRDLAQD